MTDESLELVGVPGLKLTKFNASKPLNHLRYLHLAANDLMQWLREYAEENACAPIMYGSQLHRAMVIFRDAYRGAASYYPTLKPFHSTEFTQRHRELLWTSRDDRAATRRKAKKIARAFDLYLIELSATFPMDEPPDSDTPSR